MRILAAIFVLLIAAPVHAQAWATRDVCVVDRAKVHEEVFAPVGYTEIQRASRKIENGVGKFWRITSPGGKVSHLWGTIHSNQPMLLDLPQKVEREIDAARVVALEMDYIPNTRREIFEHATRNRYRNRGEPSFMSLGLPSELESWIRDRFVGIGWGHDGPDILTLEEVAGVLLWDVCNDFNDSTYPIQDSRIQMLGALAGASIVGLEPADAITNTLKDPDNLDLVEAMIATYGAYLNPEASPKETATYYALYLEGRLAEWMIWEHSYMDHLFPDGQGLDWLRRTDDYLLVKRNHDFLATALPELDEGGVFIAIGAFHLPGTEGMVTLLRNEGFTVERVVLPGEAPS